MDLPVLKVLPELADALRTRGSAVLCVPPGGGKTTLTPQFLLRNLFPDGGKIVMLEPRRVAARAAAARIAHLLGESPGETAGYRTRLDSRISSKTRIEVVTEGILTRMIQDDPSLEGIRLLIFDEFHERSIHADLALALALDARQILRPDLRILVMSATLDSERIAALLGNAPAVTGEGRVFPVETLYRPVPASVRLEDAVLSRVQWILESQESGDILVFLPGEGEIRRAREKLAGALPGSVRILPLYGALSPAEQDRAIEPDPDGLRKVILSTPVAETSLTIDGVTAVIDSGLVRVPKFSPRNGMNRLETESISLASAEQRRGRAGRTAPGLCLRMWSPDQEKRMKPFSAPEILDCDLLPLALELLNWGTPLAEAGTALRWLDPPPKARLDQAAGLLRSLGAAGPAGTITPHGREMLRLGLHPRLAHAVLAAKKIPGAAAAACRAAAILTERGFLLRETCDLRTHPLLSGSNFHGPELESALRTERLAGIRDSHPDASRTGLVLALAFPDRIGFSRAHGSGDYALSNGTGARLRYRDHLAGFDLIAAADVEGEGARQTIYSAAPLDPADLEAVSPELITHDFEIVWNSAKKAVTAERLTKIGEMTVDRRPAMNTAPRERVLAVLLQGIRECGIAVLPFGKGGESLRERVNFLHRNMPDSGLPDFSDEALMNSLEDWLAPFLDGITGVSGLAGLDLHSALLARLDHRQKQTLDREAPERITVPSGSAIRVDYSPSDGIPLLPVKLQEIFGLMETPRLAGGRIAVAVQMLSPAMRPIQTTRDLAGFWRGSYFLVRKEMRGRYPKHNWPENPLDAVPSRRTTKK